MSEHFSFDVFLSHSAEDKAVVRTLAERLRADGLRVWWYEGDVEEGLKQSRVLGLCMWANSFGGAWVGWGGGTVRFRDPLNTERRFIPVRLDDAPIRGSLSQYDHINWLPADRDAEYPKLLEACRLLKAAATPERPSGKVISLGHTGSVY